MQGNPDSEAVLFIQLDRLLYEVEFGNKFDNLVRFLRVIWLD